MALAGRTSGRQLWGRLNAQGDGRLGHGVGAIAERLAAKRRLDLEDGVGGHVLPADVVGLLLAVGRGRGWGGGGSQQLIGQLLEGGALESARAQGRIERQTAGSRGLVDGGGGVRLQRAGPVGSQVFVEQALDDEGGGIGLGGLGDGRVQVDEPAGEVVGVGVFVEVGRPLGRGLWMARARLEPGRLVPFGEGIAKARPLG